MLAGAGAAGAAAAGAGLYTWRRNRSTPPLRSSSRNPDHPRLVLYYVPCTVPAWAVNPFNKDIGFTPNLARFAEKSAVFMNNSVEIGASGISYASLFTGAHADQHGVFSQPEILQSPLPQISQVFANNGYDTFYFDAHAMAKFGMNYGAGSRHVADYLLTPGHWLFDELLDKLATDRNYRAFVMTSFTITHSVYPFQPTLRNRIQDYGLTPAYRVKDLPAERKAVGLSLEEVEQFHDIYQNSGRDALQLQWDFPSHVRELNFPPAKLEKYLYAITYLFKLNVARLDALFGKTVERIRERGLMEESVIAFTADHGEIMHRDNAFFKFTHGNQQAPEVLRTPFLIYGPCAGVKPGLHKYVTRSVDAFPTLAGLCAQAMPDGAAPQGADLSATLRGSAAPPDLEAFSHEVVPDPENYGRLKEFKTLMKVHPPDGGADAMWASVRNPDHIVKFVKTDIGDPAPRLVAFHVPSDPEERRDIYDPANPVLTGMASRLEEYRKRLALAHSQWERRRTQSLTDSQKTRKLKDMGYIK